MRLKQHEKITIDGVIYTGGAELPEKSETKKPEEVKNDNSTVKQSKNTRRKN